MKNIILLITDTFRYDNLGARAKLHNLWAHYAAETFVRPGEDGGVPAQSVTPWVTDGRWGMAPVGQSGIAELYDVVADPLAENDVAAEHPDVVQRLRDGLEDHLRRHAAPVELVDCLIVEP